MSATYDLAKFDNATYYDCRDGESLEHLDPDAAIEELFDFHHEEGVSIQESVKDMCPVGVVAYKRKVVDNALPLATAHIDNMLESFEEGWTEEYGSFEDDHPPFDEDMLKVVSQTLAAAFAEHIEKARVWQCDVVATREYSEDEVLAVLKENCPHWFKETDDGKREAATEATS